MHWVVFGYSFSFGPGTRGYGNFDWVGLRNVGQEPNPDYSATIPHVLFMLYQMMFAIITPVCVSLFYFFFFFFLSSSLSDFIKAIISGAIVERMSFRAYIIFLLLWTTIVYDCIGKFTNNNT